MFDILTIGMYVMSLAVKVIWHLMDLVIMLVVGLYRTYKEKKMRKEYNQ